MMPIEFDIIDEKLEPYDNVKIGELFYFTCDDPKFRGC